jgi:hypothetical protein
MEGTYTASGLFQPLAAPSQRHQVAQLLSQMQRNMDEIKEEQQRKRTFSYGLEKDSLLERYRYKREVDELKKVENALQTILKEEDLRRQKKYKQMMKNAQQYEPSSKRRKQQRQRRRKTGGGGGDSSPIREENEQNKMNSEKKRKRLEQLKQLKRKDGEQRGDDEKYQSDEEERDEQGKVHRRHHTYNSENPMTYRSQTSQEGAPLSLCSLTSFLFLFLILLSLSLLCLLSFSRFQEVVKSLALKPPPLRTTAQTRWNPSPSMSA